MRKFKSMHQAQRFLGAHAAVYNLFNLGRHLSVSRKLSIFSTACFCVLGKRSGDIGCD